MSTVPELYQPIAPRPRFIARSKPSDNLVYFAVVLGYLLLLPTQMNLSIGGSELPPYRFMLLPSILLIMNNVMKGRLRATAADLLILFAVAWISLAMFMNTGGIEAFTAAVANSVDIAVAYFFARVTFGTPRDFRLFLVLMAPGLALVAIVIMIESITFTPHTALIFSDLFGGRVRAGFDARLGFMRAFGPFPHPILAGIFLASFLPLYVLGGVRSWPRFLGILAALLSFFTVSSATMLALIASTYLLTYNWLTEKFSNFGWRIFLAGGAIAALALELFTQNGAMSVLARYAALNTATARHRISIWNYGTMNVQKNPWFGIGYNDWERPGWMLPSVDHYWLLLAMQFGAIVPFIIGLAIALVVIASARASTVLPHQDSKLMRGLAISLAVFAFGAVSVSIWESVQVWFYLLAGASMSLASQALSVRRSARPTMQPRLYPA